MYELSINGIVFDSSADNLFEYYATAYTNYTVAVRAVNIQNGASSWTTTNIRTMSTGNFRSCESKIHNDTMKF